MSSLDTSSQQPQSDTSAANLDPKMEVKQQDEEEESDAGSCSKGGKLSNLKTEEKPVKSELKKEECSGEGGKGVPMDTSTTVSASCVKTEDRKPEVKKEVKEEEETSEAAVPQAPVKKKSKEDFSFYQKIKFLNHGCIFKKNISLYDVSYS